MLLNYTLRKTCRYLARFRQVLTAKFWYWWHDFIFCHQHTSSVTHNSDKWATHKNLTISSRERQNNETEIKKILFDHSRSIDQKMVEIRKIAKNIRLLIGFKTKEEFRETVSMLKANGVSIIALKSYRRPNYFHILAKLHANSPEAQDFIGSF